MKLFTDRILTLLKRVHDDSLYRNSLYLMAGTAAMAVFGFLFWIIAAKFYTPEQIGLTTAFISVVTLIGNFSLLGLNTALIRYLPTSTQKSQKINTALTVAGIAAGAIACVYFIGINIFSPKLSFLLSTPLGPVGTAGILIFFFILSTVNFLTDSVFIAFRQTQYILFVNTLMSILKISLMIALASFGIYGIVGSNIVAIVFASLLSVFFIIRAYRFPVLPALNMHIIRQVFRYSIGNYVSGFINMLPGYILPILITNTHEAHQTAYFYMAQMTAGFLYIIPQSTTSSLFAEGSYTDGKLRQLLLQAAKATGALLAPALVALLVFHPLILQLIGASYVTNSSTLVVILSINSIPVALNFLIANLLRIKHAIRLLVYITIAQSTVTLIYAVATIHLGIIHAAWSLFVGQIVGVILGSICIRIVLSRKLS